MKLKTETALRKEPLMTLNLNIESVVAEVQDDLHKAIDDGATLSNHLDLAVIVSGQVMNGEILITYQIGSEFSSDKVTGGNLAAVHKEPSL